MRHRFLPAAAILVTAAALVPSLRAGADPVRPARRAACPTSPNYVVIDCNVGDAINAEGMFAGALEHYGVGWIAVYMKNWSDGTTTYHTGYTAQNPAANPFSDNWTSKSRLWRPDGTDSKPQVVDPGLVIFGTETIVATQPSQIFTSHSITPAVADSFLTPAAMTVCTGDLDPGCLSTEGNGKVSEVSLRPVDMPIKHTIYAVYSFCPGSSGCTVDKPQEIHLRIIPKVQHGGQYAPWGLPVVCAEDSGWANPVGSDVGRHQRAVAITLKRSGTVGTKMACIYNQYQDGGARTIGMTTSTDGLTWSAPSTIAKETGFDLHNPYAITMLGGSNVIRVYYQRYNYDGHCTGTGRNWTLNYIESANGGDTWTKPLGSDCTGITYPKEITSTSRPIFAQAKADGHVYCFSTWIDLDTTVLGIFDTKT